MIGLVAFGIVKLNRQSIISPTSISIAPWGRGDLTDLTGKRMPDTSIVLQEGCMVVLPWVVPAELVPRRERA